MGKARAKAKIIQIEPTDEFPVPYDTTDQEVKSFLEEITVAANTAELLVEMGAPLELDEDTEEEAKRLVDAVKKRETKNLNQVSTAFGAAAFLREYGQQLALDVNQVRAALTFKLMEIANCGDTKFELKALELLGKHSDIGLFTSKSEITINYKDPTELENAIKERVKRLLNADVIDAVPLSLAIDDELEVFSRGASQTQVGEFDGADAPDEEDADASEGEDDE